VKITNELLQQVNLSEILMSFSTNSVMSLFYERARTFNKAIYVFD